MDLGATIDKLNGLKQVLPEHGRVLIIPHDYPDPDALAAAAALHLLLAKRYNVSSQIVFTGMVSRAENKEMLHHFRYAWHLLDAVREPRRKLPCIVVDAVPWSGNVTIPSFAKPVAVLDHHAPVPSNKARDMFVDVRSGIGATVSILYEYLLASEITIPPWLATMMMYAIATETLDLSRNCTEPDLQAYLGLLARANMGLLGKIRHARLPRVYFAQIKEAMRNARVYGRVAWSHMDDVSQPEIVPEIAELLLRLERIAWSLCTAYQGDKMVISLRSNRRGAHCGRLLKRLVRGDGSAGGHEWMAGGVIGLEGKNPEEFEARRMQLVRNLLARTERRGGAGDEALELQARPLVESG